MAAEVESVETLLDRLRLKPAGLRITLVTGRPDDEVLGAGSRLRAIAAGVSIVCLTDGAPRNTQVAAAAGCSSLPYPGSPEIRIDVSEDEQRLKRRMIECYASQGWIREAFPCDVERFRPAPEYNFCSAPHQGKLLYERFDWGVTGLKWRTLAREAARRLGLR